MNTDYKEQINTLRKAFLKLWPTGDDVLKEEAWEAWENSLYMRALDLLEDVNSQFIKKTADGVQMAFITIDPTGEIIDQDDGEYIQPQYKEPNRLTIGKETKFDPEAENITAKEQAVIYYFLSNPAEDPTSQDYFTTEQLRALLNAFIDLDNYYFEISDSNNKAIDITKEFYNFLNADKKSPYRTRAKAQEAGAITDIPQMLAVPTHKGFEHSITFYNKGAAYLQQLKATTPLKFENGLLSIDGLPFKAELQDITTQENIEEIDLPILSVFFTIILHQFQASGYEELNDTVKISVPDLARYMGLPSNLNRERIQNLIDKIKSYHHIIGVIPNKKSHRKNPLPDLTTVLVFHNYFEDTNTIEFSSPYMNRIINIIFEETLRKTKQGEIQRKSNGDPKFLPDTYSYLIKGSIAKARDRLAIENVKIIIQGIERAGNNTYNIAVKTLIERNTQLKKRLEDDPTHQARLLKQVFKNTWQLLKDETELEEKYINIVLPDPNNPANIPTVKDIESKVFVITHDGKKK